MRVLLIAAVLTLAAAPTLAQSADDHKPDAPKAACRASEGKPCPKKPAKPATKAKLSTPMITQCRDVISHKAAKCGGPNAEPVPAN